MDTLTATSQYIDLTGDASPEGMLDVPLQPAAVVVLPEEEEAEASASNTHTRPSPVDANIISEAHQQQPPPAIHASAAFPPSPPPPAPSVVVEMPSDEDAQSTDEPAEVEVSGDDDDDGDEAEDHLNWDNESVLSDIVQAMGSDEDADGKNDSEGQTGAGSPDRLARKADLIKLLQKLGPHEFIFQVLESDMYSPKGLCTVLGGRMVLDIDDLPEDHPFYYKLLGKIINREISKRVKLEKYNTVDDAVELLRKSKKILVLTGAGISTSLGIPDFRSANGLYNMLRESPIGDLVDDPQDVFSLKVFLDNPSIFFTVAKSILSIETKFSPTHSFIKLLQDRGQLLTNYTQNIDNFEACAGIDAAKLVHCHGSFATATCIECKARVPGSDIEPEIAAGRIPRCKVCLESLARRRLSAGPSGMKRKRSSNAVSASKKASKAKRDRWADSSSDEDDDMEDLSDDAAGVMKPDIVFFGEDLPHDFHRRLSDVDRAQVDLAIVIGTSLMVAPVSEVPGFLPSTVPQIYISREPCRHINFDIELLGDCDRVVAELCRRLAWPLRHAMIPPPAARPDTVVSTLEGSKHRHRFVSAGAHEELQAAADLACQKE